MTMLETILKLKFCQYKYLKACIVAIKSISPCSVCPSTWSMQSNIYSEIYSMSSHVQRIGFSSLDSLIVENAVQICMMYHAITNINSSAVLQATWKLTNEIFCEFFIQAVMWTGIKKKILLKLVGLLRRWMAAW